MRLYIITYQSIKKDFPSRRSPSKSWLLDYRISNDYNTPTRTRLKDSGVINKYEAI